MNASLFPDNGTQLRLAAGIGTDRPNTERLTQRLGGHLDSVMTHEVQIGLTQDVVSLDLQPRLKEQVRLALAVDGTVSRLFSEGVNAGSEALVVRNAARAGMALGVEHTVVEGEYRLRFDALGGVDWSADRALYLGGRISLSTLVPRPSNRLPILGDPPPAVEDPGLGLFGQVDLGPSGATRDDLRMSVGALLQF